MVPFQPGRLSQDAYATRRNATTAEQLPLLLADPAFAAWRRGKASRDNWARVVAGAISVQARDGPPAAATQAADPVEHLAGAQLMLARQEHEAALDAIRNLTRRLHEAEEARAAATNRLAALDARQEPPMQGSDGGRQQLEAAQLVVGMTGRLEEMRGEVAAAEAAADAAAALAEAAVAASEALVGTPVPLAAHAPTCPPATPLLLLKQEPGVTSALGLCSPGDATTATSTAATLGDPSSALSPAPFYCFLAVLACTALAALVHLRAWATAAAEAQRAARLAARLKETSFAKDTAEQSLALLESELQRRMKQLEEVQQRAADAASPKIGAMLAQHTPCKGELPPPPASLVEKFLRDHNFLAVQQEQMQEWLEMEQQFGELQTTLGELQAVLADKDAQIASLEQDFGAVQEHSSLAVRTLQDQLGQVRSWLDEAQEELLNTQASLQEREGECRLLNTQLEAMHAFSQQAQALQESAAKGRGAELLEQNLELVTQLQNVTAAYEEMQAQLAASSGSGTALALASDRPVSVASPVPGTPAADLTREVQSCLDMMRATRVHLADRLAHSAGVCQAVIADCQLANSKGDLAAGQAAAAEPYADQQATRVSASSSMDGSMRQAWEAAHACVAEVRAQHTAWDLAGFVRDLGFEKEPSSPPQIGEQGSVPVDRSDFVALKAAAVASLKAAAAGAASPQQRALAGEAMQMLHAWEWPVQHINTPPPSPFWRMLGLEA